jgi:hypothetical protein
MSYNESKDLSELLKYSAETLAQMDHNLEVYMNDQLRQKNAELEAVIDNKDATIVEMGASLAKKDASLAEKDSEIATLKAQLAELTK